MELIGARLVCLLTFVLLLTSTSAAQSRSEVAVLVVALAIIIILAGGAELEYRRRPDAADVTDRLCGR